MPEVYLDSVEGICRFTLSHLDERGAVIDPLLGREHQYSTPYFAFAVGALVKSGRALDLLPYGTQAMEHATACFALGADGIPDRHGEFFLASLPGALELYEGLVADAVWRRWRERLAVPVENIVSGLKNNWRTYAMRGEWMRAKLGLVEVERARAFIEHGWLEWEQRERISGDKWNLYQDHQTDPESHAVEAVGRVNLLALVAAGYDGESAAEIASCAERGTATSLLLQDPTGQCPPNGRADNHIFNDVLYLLGFELAASRSFETGDLEMAGQYRRAALLSHQSIQRWRRDDGEWAGSFYVTKNRFDPSERVGYQAASQYTNYNGAVMLHLAEAYLAAREGIDERPAPCEVGDFAFATDERFASAVANAGGMQMFAVLRGDVEPVYGHYWSALGVERFSRVGWDSRLGPSDGVRDVKSGRGISFGPTWKEDGVWVRIADVPGRYRGYFGVTEECGELVRCEIEYRSLIGTGPVFRHEFEVRPEGVVATLTAEGVKEFGVTWPVLVDDGALLRVEVSDDAVIFGFKDGAEVQRFVSEVGGEIEVDGEELLSSYGWLKAFRVGAVDGVQRTVVRPGNVKLGAQGM